MKLLIIACLAFAASLASASTSNFFVKTQSGLREDVIAALTPLGYEVRRIRFLPDWVSVRGPDQIEVLRQIPNVILVEGEAQFHLLDDSACPQKFSSN